MTPDGWARCFVGRSSSIMLPQAGNSQHWVPWASLQRELHPRARAHTHGDRIGVLVETAKTGTSSVMLKVRGLKDTHSKDEAEGLGPAGCLRRLFSPRGRGGMCSYPGEPSRAANGDLPSLRFQKGSCCFYHCYHRPVPVLPSTMGWILPPPHKKDMLTSLPQCQRM